MLSTLRRGARHGLARASRCAHIAQQAQAQAARMTTSTSSNGRWKAAYAALGALGGLGAAAAGSVATLKYMERPAPPAQLSDALKEPMAPLFNLGKHHLIDRPDFTQAIATCLDSAASGLFVVWAPADSGKTNCMEQAAKRWLHGADAASTKRHVRFLSSYSAYDNPNALLQNSLHVRDADDLRCQLEETGYEVLIVLDQFDEAFHGDTEQLRRFTVELAAAAKRSKKLRVLVGLQNPNRAKMALGWNASKKIHLCGEFPHSDASKLSKLKWTRDEALKFLAGVGAEWTDEDKECFCAAACTSGNIATLIMLKGDKSLLHDTATQATIDADAQMWKTGIAILSNRPRKNT